MVYNENYIAIPPGETILEQLEIENIDINEFCAKMTMSEDSVNQLLNGKIFLTSQIAHKLEDTLGIPANFWLKLEDKYRQKLSLIQNESIILKCN